jgi:hypothetical protein
MNTSGYVEALQELRRRRGRAEVLYHLLNSDVVFPAR